MRDLLKKNKVYILISLAILLLIVLITIFKPGFKSFGSNILTPDADSIPPKPDTTVVTLAFLGDLMGHMPVMNSGFDPATGTYDYSYCFPLVRPYFKSVDLVIGNLETTLAGPPYHGFPMFSSPDDYARSLKENHILFMVTSNNHSYDKGRKGIERTLYVLDSLGIEHTGTFRDTAHRSQTYPYIKEIKGLKFAILNYTYGTNGLTVYPPSIVNGIDSVQMLKDIQKAENMQPDYIIAVLHWGNEYQRKPAYEQTSVAAFLASSGVDAVIGAHPHVVQTVEFIPGKDSAQQVPVVYSMGNFLSNQRDRYKDGGLIAELTFKKYETQRIPPALKILPFWVFKKEGPSKYYILPEGVLEHSPGALKLSSTDLEKAKQFFADTRLLIPNAVYHEFYRNYNLDSAKVSIP